MPALNTTIVAESAFNETADVLKVICAWPVSGQYGTGSRVLYYVLIATCLLGRKSERLVNAFLAVGLILPAVAALHGIVLAALHQDGAVDMDIYGAFQLCSIGILAAPVTVMMSETFFRDPGRNVMFLWTLLVFIGLMCLGIEFYRIQAFECPFSDSSQTLAISPNAAKFPYSDSITCGLRCSPAERTSPMRGGAADNVYVIPAPSVLTFGTTTLLTAACCVHAILCLLSMWSKVVSNYWKRASAKGENNVTDAEEAEDGTGATKSTVESINKVIRHYLSMVAIPVFGGAGIAIIIVGEINFFSEPVRYQTEPMGSIGQWGPIAATALAMIGSLYLIVLDYARPPSKEVPASEVPLEDLDRGRSASPLAVQQARTNTTSATEAGEEPAARSNAGRTRVANFLNRMGDVLGSPPEGLRQENMGESRAQGYPVVPGEVQRAARLASTTEAYSAMRSPSRTPSFRAVSPSTGSSSASPAHRAATMPSQPRSGPRRVESSASGGIPAKPRTATRRITSPR